jgi:hypothetical protein
MVTWTPLATEKLVPIPTNSLNVKGLVPPVFRIVILIAPAGGVIVVTELVRVAGEVIGEAEISVVTNPDPSPCTATRLASTT